MSRLLGRIAVITGGGTGIGLGIARALAVAGCDVVIGGRREQVLREAAESCDPPLKFHAVDVGDRNSVQTLSGWVEKIVKRIYRSDSKTMTRLGRGKSRYDLQGRKWVEQGEHRKAMGAFLQAIDDQPSDSASLYNAGLVSEALGDYRRALGFHQRARRLANHGDYNLAAMRVETILLSGQVAE